MVGRRLIPVLLVLLHSGLVACAHEHAEPNSAPHAHIHDLLDLPFPHDPGDDGEHDGSGGHDDDAFYLTPPTVLAPMPSVDAVGVDLPPLLFNPFHDCASETHFPLGLPPSTAGPSRPLYLTLCSLRN